MTEALPRRMPSGEPPRLLVTDLDGTLLDARGQISPADRQALAALQAAGIPVLFATGRTWPAAQPVAAALGLRAPLVIYNGARVVSPTGQVLYERWLPRAAVELAEQLARRHGVRGFACLPDRLVPLAGGEAYVHYLVEEDRALVQPAAVAPWQVGTIPPQRAAIKLLFLGSPQACDGFEAACRAYPRVLRPVRSGQRCVEVLPPGVSKATGLAFVLKQLGLRPAQVVAVGDGLNDLEMLELAGHPVAVATAEPALLKRARFLAPPPPQGPLATVARTFFAHALEANRAALIGPRLNLLPCPASPAGNP